MWWLSLSLWTASAAPEDVPVFDGADIRVAVADPDARLLQPPRISLGQGTIALTDDGRPPDARAGDRVWSGSLAAPKEPTALRVFGDGDALLWTGPVGTEGGTVRVEVSEAGIQARVKSKSAAPTRKGAAPLLPPGTPPPRDDEFEAELMSGVLGLIGLAAGGWLALTFGPGGTAGRRRQARR